MKLSACIRLKLLTKTALLLLLSCIFCAPAKAQIYTEPYRPQFHVSPALGFMGDPNNMKWVMTCGIGPNQRVVLLTNEKASFFKEKSEK